MPYCSILECKNHSRSKNLSRGGISYHRFPIDPFIKEKWINATGRLNWFPTKTSTICSQHFMEDDFIIKASGNKYIKVKAEPSQNILTRSYLPGRIKQEQDINNPTSSTSQSLVEITIKEEKSLSGNVFPDSSQYDDCKNTSEAMEINAAVSTSNNVVEIYTHKKRKIPSSNNQLTDTKKEVADIEKAKTKSVVNILYSMSDSLEKRKIIGFLEWKDSKILLQRRKIRKLQARIRSLRKKNDHLNQILESVEEKFPGTVRS